MKHDKKSDDQQAQAADPTPGLNRWWIAAMGTLLQMCLGSVYAWSYFQKPLVEGYGWQNSQVTWTFSVAIGFLGIAAAVGGVLLPRLGPRVLALSGVLFYAAGHFLAALALTEKSLVLLWGGYGVLGGIGLGLGYVTPVATVAKWFPDRKGLVTGMVVMGFGFGALLMSKGIAPALQSAFSGSLPRVFEGAGILVAIVGGIAAWTMMNPAGAWAAAGPAKPAEETGGTAWSRLCSREFAYLWLLFFCNITAGIALIGFQSPLMQDLRHRADPSLTAAELAAGGATLIAVSSVFNGLGRLFWGALSDRLGQLRTFRLMLGTQVLAFCALAVTKQPWVFGALVCYVLLCYGGGFGIMPSFVSGMFGARLMPLVYGCVLTAWSAAGVVGPQVVAQLKDRYGADAPLRAFGLGAGLLAAGWGLSWIMGKRKPS
jgi:MFS transporter, OFA family, oxalate/formate antiporter